MGVGREWVGALVIGACLVTGCGGRSPPPSESDAGGSSADDPTVSADASPAAPLPGRSVNAGPSHGPPGTANLPPSGETPRSPGRTGRTASGPSEAPGDGAPNEASASSSSTPEQALATAGELLRQSQASQRGGDSLAAFEQASQAYALVRQFPDDANCSALARQIYGGLTDLSQRADRSSQVQDLEFKTLIVE